MRLKILDTSSILTNFNAKVKEASDLIFLQIPKVPINVISTYDIEQISAGNATEEMSRQTGKQLAQVRHTETGLPILLMTPHLVLASVSWTNAEMLKNTRLVVNFSSIIATSASTPFIVASALRPAGIADQQCTLKQNVKPSPDVKTVGDLNDLVLGTT